MVQDGFEHLAPDVVEVEIDSIGEVSARHPEIVESSSEMR